MKHVFERRIDALEHFANVIVGAENRAEAHGNDGVSLHYGFDNVLVSEGIFTGRIENVNRGVADHGGDVLIVDGIDHLSGATDSDFSKINPVAALQNAIDIAAALSRGGRARSGVLVELYANIIF